MYMCFSLVVLGPMHAAEMLYHIAAPSDEDTYKKLAHKIMEAGKY